MPESIQSHLNGLHQLYSDAILDNPQIMRNYVWTVAKQLSINVKDIDSFTCRQLLADCIKLPLERPSRLYSTLLSAAVKVADTYPEFRFVTFMNMWGIENLRPEDSQRQQSKDGRTFPSIVERTAKALGRSLLLHPEASTAASPTPSSSAPAHEAGRYDLFLSQNGFNIQPMLVTRTQETIAKDGRRLRFTTLTSPDGLEVETIVNKLQPNPLRPVPEGRRHYINIGQLYDCLIQSKQESTSPALVCGVLSNAPSTSLFPTEIGYIEAIDTNSGLMHIYDRFSRHFVAHILRFSKEQTGDFVRFLPIIPRASKFKTAIIIGRTTVPEASPEGLVRTIRITAFNTERHYASWELCDTSHPITEQLSPLQLSQGETSPAFTTGYLNLPQESETPHTGNTSSSVPDELLSCIAPGHTFRAIVYLKRGKDRQKRPHIARIFS